MIQQTNHGQPGPFAPPPLQGSQHYYEPVRQRVLRRYSRPRWRSSLCRQGTPCRRGLNRSSVGTRLLTFRTRAADGAHATSTPDTTWPISGHPPGSSRSTHQTPVSMSSKEFRCFSSGRLPSPYLTPPGRLFLIAHHDGLQPTQHEVVWSLPPQGGSEGPTFISRTAPHQESLPTCRAPLCVRDTRCGSSGVTHTRG